MPRCAPITRAQAADALRTRAATRLPWKTIAGALGCSREALFRACKRLTNKDDHNTAVAGHESAAVEPNPRTLSASPEAAHGNALGDER